MQKLAYLAAQMNEVEALPQMMLQQVANDAMLRINDVALRANGHSSAVIWREVHEIFTLRV